MNAPLAHVLTQPRVAPMLALASAALLALASFAGTSSTPSSGAHVIQAGAVAVQPQKFLAIDVLLDSGQASLAAYQITLVATTADVRLIGIEGGEHPAFADAPFYDPAALQRDRVILAAFSTDDNLPRGLTRVARLHIACDESTEPTFSLTLEAAADAQGRGMNADTIHASTRTLEAAIEGGPSAEEPTPAASHHEHTPVDPGTPNSEGINP